MSIIIIIIILIERGKMLQKKIFLTLDPNGEKIVDYMEMLPDPR
jgi:hypothetical protein